MPTPDGMISRKTVLKAAAALGAAPLLVGGGVALAREQAGTGRPPASPPSATTATTPPSSRPRAPTSSPTPHCAAPWSTTAPAPG